MPLEKYRKKRDFQKTSEPPGEATHEPAGRLAYVIQKHQATRLHWDLRLERDGVLKSWAVPKEPPTKAGERRLAVEVEDHPLEYGSFAGEIPAGGYGAGTVEIWDRGHFVPMEWEENAIVIEIHGEKLEGTYCLIRFQPDKDPKNWLFFKKKS
ncbi:MAG: 3'-phosphoesterase [Candidatus Fraserbacteria bacterium RBG_16_55_9]|uniref:3'-phosphoesterase n=1 Tax=Fraserbacteria sp. (strain RBG_16_55_9) TaxID=1817864 RepID=A0A1F5V0J2_FRAXR|nr:MAG: 3'-phosphoesterase [Candidatus Fraserbacteria bacterium RBG_16_55_9]